MLVIQARPGLSADLFRPLPRLLGFRPARRPVCPVDAATQPHLPLREAQGLLRRLLQSFSRRYAGYGSLRLERPSFQSKHGSLRFTRRSAGDGSLHLECRSSQPRHGSLRLKRRSVGDGSPRFGCCSPQLWHSSGDRSLRFGRRSSQPRHGRPCIKHRPPQPRAAQ